MQSCRLRLLPSSASTSHTLQALAPAVFGPLTAAPSVAATPPGSTNATPSVTSSKTATVSEASDFIASISASSSPFVSRRSQLRALRGGRRRATAGVDQRAILFTSEQLVAAPSSTLLDVSSSPIGTPPIFASRNVNESSSPQAHVQSKEQQTTSPSTIKSEEDGIATPTSGAATMSFKRSTDGSITFDRASPLCQADHARAMKAQQRKAKGRIASLITGIQSERKRGLEDARRVSEKEHVLLVSLRNVSYDNNHVPAHERQHFRSHRQDRNTHTDNRGSKGDSAESVRHQIQRLRESHLQTVARLNAAMASRYHDAITAAVSLWGEHSVALDTATLEALVPPVLIGTGRDGAPLLAASDRPANMQSVSHAETRVAHGEKSNETNQRTTVTCRTDKDDQNSKGNASHSLLESLMFDVAPRRHVTDVAREKEAESVATLSTSAAAFSALLSSIGESSPGNSGRCSPQQKQRDVEGGSKKKHGLTSRRLDEEASRWEFERISVIAHEREVQLLLRRITLSRNLTNSNSSSITTSSPQPTDVDYDRDVASMVEALQRRCSEILNAHHSILYAHQSSDGVTFSGGFDSLHGGTDGLGQPSGMDDVTYRHALTTVVDAAISIISTEVKCGMKLKQHSTTVHSIVKRLRLLRHLTLHMCAKSSATSTNTAVRSEKNHVITDRTHDGNSAAVEMQLDLSLFAAHLLTQLASAVKRSAIESCTSLDPLWPAVVEALRLVQVMDNIARTETREDNKTRAPSRGDSLSENKRVTSQSVIWSGSPTAAAYAQLQPSYVESAVQTLSRVLADCTETPEDVKMSLGVDLVKVLNRDTLTSKAVGSVDGQQERHAIAASKSNTHAAASAFLDEFQAVDGDDVTAAPVTLLNASNLHVTPRQTVIQSREGCPLGSTMTSTVQDADVHQSAGRTENVSEGEVSSSRSTRQLDEQGSNKDGAGEVPSSRTLLGSINSSTAACLVSVMTECRHAVSRTAANAKEACDSSIELVHEIHRRKLHLSPATLTSVVVASVAHKKWLDALRLFSMVEGKPFSVHRSKSLRKQQRDAKVGPYVSLRKRLEDPDFDPYHESTFARRSDLHHTTLATEFSNKIASLDTEYPDSSRPVVGARSGGLPRRAPTPPEAPPLEFNDEAQIRRRRSDELSRLTSPNGEVRGDAESGSGETFERFQADPVLIAAVGRACLVPRPRAWDHSLMLFSKMISYHNKIASLDTVYPDSSRSVVVARSGSLPRRAPTPPEAPPLEFNDDASIRRRSDEEKISRPADPTAQVRGDAFERFRSDPMLIAAVGRACLVPRPRAWDHSLMLFSKMISYHSDSSNGDSDDGLMRSFRRPEGDSESMLLDADRMKDSSSSSQSSPVSTSSNALVWESAKTALKCLSDCGIPASQRVHLALRVLCAARAATGNEDPETAPMASAEAYAMFTSCMTMRVPEDAQVTALLKSASAVPGPTSPRSSTCALSPRKTIGEKNGHAQLSPLLDCTAPWRDALSIAAGLVGDDRLNDDHTRAQRRPVGVVDSSQSQTSLRRSGGGGTSNEATMKRGRSRGSHRFVLLEEQRLSIETSRRLATALALGLSAQRRYRESVSVVASPKELLKAAQLAGDWAAAMSALSALVQRHAEPNRQFNITPHNGTYVSSPDGQSSEDAGSVSGFDHNAGRGSCSVDAHDNAEHSSSIAALDIRAQYPLPVLRAAVTRKQAQRAMAICAAAQQRGALDKIRVVFDYPLPLPDSHVPDSMMAEPEVCAAGHAQKAVLDSYRDPLIVALTEAKAVKQRQNQRRISQTK